MPSDTTPTERPSRDRVPGPLTSHPTTPKPSPHSQPLTPQASTSNKRILRDRVPAGTPGPSPSTTTTTSKPTTPTLTEILSPTIPLPTPFTRETKIQSPGLAPYPNCHLHASHGLVIELMPCGFIVQVEPPDCEHMKAESKPAGYAHFAVLSRARLREQGISFRSPHGDLFLPAAGEVAEGFWVDEEIGCLRVGEGRVVKVYEKCDVRVVDPMRGGAWDWGCEDKFCEGGESEGENEDKDKDKDKGEKQREETPAQEERKTVRFQLPPTVRVFDEKEKVRSTVVDTRGCRSRED